MNSLTKDVSIILAIMFAFALIYHNLPSDAVSVETDHETGCQYMVNRYGGITPRIAADYMHMGCKGYEGQE